jgi:predicted ATP-dependent Lon-type protease
LNDIDVSYLFFTVSGFPEAMQIAVFTHSFHFGESHREFGNWSFSRSKFMPVHFLSGEHFYKDYIVLFFHGMRHTAYFHFDGLSQICNYRDVFFFGCIYGILLQELHRFTAANQITLTSEDSFDCVSTQWAVPDLT